jgi:hypothetical protein
MSSATPSVRRDVEYQKLHSKSDTRTLNYTVSSMMLTRHMTYTAPRKTPACNGLNDNENCAADCKDIRAIVIHP